MSDGLECFQLTVIIFRFFLMQIFPSRRDAVYIMNYPIFNVMGAKQISGTIWLAQLITSPRLRVRESKRCTFRAVCELDTTAKWHLNKDMEPNSRRNRNWLLSGIYVILVLYWTNLGTSDIRTKQNILLSVWAKNKVRGDGAGLSVAQRQSQSLQLAKSAKPENSAKSCHIWISQGADRIGIICEI